MIRRFASLAFVSLIACAGSTETSPVAPSFAGTWNLQTVDGVSLPYLTQGSGANKIELVSEQGTITSSAFTLLSNYRITNNGAVSTQSQSSTGTYTLSGSTATFRDNADASMATGTVSGNSLIVTGTSGGVSHSKGFTRQ